ncbi:uncharacterized protein ColSpa_11610 [Colletotrichum spaethianum]|uniref:Rhodopsin domain-containing protein n=1 Tax=Colletotrichum spaethianum TaxID=700344 RepID=A0AA37PFW2_9PEZI|nr:uncharacterized protein ColSpa_11610 [Colletotrichum spaethianum]GKT51429.1 hypothetical protein ColSpa_11610 [Colletotrichum spaethianum]
MSTPTADPNAVLFGAAQNVSRRVLTVICWSNVSTSIAFLLLRLFLRWRRNHCFLRDDYWMILGWLCILTMAILQMEQNSPLYYIVHLQAGRFIPTSEEEKKQQVEQYLRWSYALNFIFWTGLWAVKASILNIFFHLVSPVLLLRKLWYWVAIFTFLAYIGGWVAGSLICDHFTDLFVAGKCTSPQEFWLARFSVFYATAADITTDLLIMSLPITMLPSLQLDIKKKIGLGVAFSLALVTILTSIIRMTQVLKGDTLDMVGLATWSITELGVAIIVGSLPPLKVLLASGFKKYNRSRKNHQKPYIKDNGNSYRPDTTTRSVMVAESIPLDNRHRSEQLEGGIYVLKTCDVHFEGEDRARNEGEDVIMTKDPPTDKA